MDATAIQHIPQQGVQPSAHNFIDLTGKRFGRWKVLSYAEKIGNATAWNCQCDCGITGRIAAGNLRSGASRSCGCLKREFPRTTHGETGGVEFKIFHGAKNRCTNPTNKGYSSYGGRGIEFRFESYDAFLQALGRRPSPQHSLERIDNDSHYSPDNCKWALPDEQIRNTRRSRLITVGGVTKCAQDWSTDAGWHKNTVFSRLRYGFCDECAVTIPCGDRKGCPHR